MGFNRSGEVRKSRRKLRGDFAQMLFGSRWITVYVVSLSVGLVWDALSRVFLEAEKQTPAEAWRSARRSLERRPLLVVMTLLIGAAISVGGAELTAMGYEQLVQLLTVAALWISWKTRR